jgi:hypothetical protein
MRNGWGGVKESGEKLFVQASVGTGTHSPVRIPGDYLHKMVDGQIIGLIRLERVRGRAGKIRKTGALTVIHG